MVDRELPGITMDQLAAAQRAAIETHCMCLFEAPTPDLVREVNEAAQIPFTRVTEAVDLTPAS